MGCTPHGCLILTYATRKEIETKWVKDIHVIRPILQKQKFWSLHLGKSLNKFWIVTENNYFRILHILKEEYRIIWTQNSMFIWVKKLEETQNSELWFEIILAWNYLKNNSTILTMADLSLLPAQWYSKTTTDDSVSAQTFYSSTQSPTITGSKLPDTDPTYHQFISHWPTM